MPLTDIQSTHLPYCLARQNDGRYVVLNRDYKPIGFRTTEHEDYSKHPIAVKISRLSARTAARLSHNNDQRVDRIYLYDDACIPTSSSEHMAAYLQRLAILAKLKVS